MLHAESANPRVCVVVPILNEVRFLRESMDSLMAQDYQPLEIIVYDGGSSDGSLDILKTYPVELIVEPGLGQMAAINRGWRRTSAEYVTWWAGDDTYYPGAIRRLASELQAHPEAGLVHGDYDEIDVNGDVLRHFVAGNLQLRGLVDFNLKMAAQATLIRKTALQKSGMLDENRRLAADLDLFLRLAQYYPTHYVPFTAATRRMHPDSEDAKDVEAVFKAVIDVTDSFFRRPDLTPPQSSLRRRGVACSRINLGSSYIAAGKHRQAGIVLWEGVRTFPPILFDVAYHILPWIIRLIQMKSWRSG